MNRFVVPSLLLVSMVSSACGPRARSADTERKQAVDGPPIAAHLEVQVQGGVQFSFRVTNNEPRKVELMFPSGQTHDFVVIDSVGREMWRWSEDRMFTQVVTTRLLDSGATLTWDAECGATLPPGRYTAIGLLTSENKPMEQRVTFEVK